MSHYTVLVVTDPDTNENNLEEKLAEQLNPYHEFECTDRMDEYVINVDELDEARQDYAKATSRFYKAPNGDLEDPYQDKFYREPTAEEVETHHLKIGGSGCGGGISWSSRDWGDGKGYRAKIHYVPEGYEDVRLDTTETQSFKDYVVNYYDRPHLEQGAEPDLDDKHRYGWYTEVDGEVVALVRRTNPNAKWDWYVVGGRWSGSLQLKPGAAGISVSDEDTTRCNSARKSDVDFDAEQKRRHAEKVKAIDAVFDRATVKSGKTKEELLAALQATADAHDEIDAAFQKARGENPKERWYDFLETYDHDALRLVLQAGLWGTDEESLTGYFGPVRLPFEVGDPYAWALRESFATYFAFLRDKKWAARGEMGWWACVSNEDASWSEAFQALLADVPDDHWLTVVDCHI